MGNKYIKESKVVKVGSGEMVLEVTINTELLIEDLAEGLTSIIVEMAKGIREFLEVVVTFIDALPKNLQDDINEKIITKD